MPIYEYECRRCKHRFELIQKHSDKPRKRCPECSGAVDRLISSPAIRFKGTGWYVTDYADKSKADRAAADAKAEAGDKKTESGNKKTESDSKAKKSAAKTDKKAS